jgi:DNA-binding CsgD family transcriptional regulator
MSIRLSPLEMEVLRRTAAGNPRATAVLLSAEGRTNGAVAEEVGVTERTVVRWLQRFRAGGIEALDPRYRAGRPPLLTATQVAEIMRRLGTAPRAYGRWPAEWVSASRLPGASHGARVVKGTSQANRPLRPTHPL